MSYKDAIKGARKYVGAKGVAEDVADLEKWRSGQYSSLVDMGASRFHACAKRLGLDADESQLSAAATCFKELEMSARAVALKDDGRTANQVLGILQQGQPNYLLPAISKTVNDVFALDSASYSKYRRKLFMSCYAENGGQSFPPQADS
ncbi:hypothetical protein GJQ57_16200 [Ralstonia pickettii]|uniref:Uncharacterized protein n=1 Tax=Ralstonia pickettii TaxID=329 RepID=A0A7X2HPA4_RALPI|nr:hypothetical protein [Ralstonia pickettii]MRT00184.1 hypothetical protein [Ralstonia pickettii]